MPLLRIQTNSQVLQGQRDRLLAEASEWVSRELNKPMDYVQVTFEATTMVFAGSSAPSAFLELRALALPEDRTRELAASLTRLVGVALGVEPARIFINFVDVPRHLWGWNAGTFG